MNDTRQHNVVKWLHDQKNPNIWINHLVLTDKNSDQNSPKLLEKDAICLFDILTERRLLKHEPPNKYFTNKYADWNGYIFELKYPVIFFIKSNWLNIVTLLLSILAIFISIYSTFK